MKAEAKMQANIIDVIFDCEDWQLIDDVKGFCINTVSKVLDYCNVREGNIAISLTSDENITELNHQFRGKNKSTNVLSFPDDDRLGDIAISYQTIKSEAEQQGKNIKDHLAHMLVHGVLHLLGHDHEEDNQAEEMEELERKILADLSIGDPYK